MATTITERLAAAFATAAPMGLKQADIARRIGVSRATVNDWFQGRSVNLRPEHLFAVADLLQVEARWLATGQGPRERTRTCNDDHRLLTDIAALSNGDRAAVRLLIHQIADARGDYTA